MVSIVELLNRAVEVPWVVFSESKLLLTFFEAGDAGKPLNEHYNMLESYEDHFIC